MANTIDVDTGEVLPVGQTAFGAPALLDQLQRAAQRYPRPAPEKIQAQALAEVEIQPERAGELYYALPFRRHTHQPPCTSRSDDACPCEWAEGPSVKIARQLLRLWHNAGVSSHVVEEDVDGGLVRGVAVDFECNSIVSIERKVSRYEGKNHLGESRWALKLAAAQAKAERNAILELIPDWLVHPIVSRAMALAAERGDVRTITDMRSAFQRLGVPLRALEGAIGHPIAEGRMTSDELQRLRGLYGSLQRGEVQPEEVAAALGVDPDPAADAAERQAVQATRDVLRAELRAEEAQDAAVKPTQTRVRARRQEPTERSAQRLPRPAPEEAPKAEPAEPAPVTPAETPPEGPDEEGQLSWL